MSVSLRYVVRPAAIGLALLLLLTGVRPSHASYEEFQTFDVGRQEEDDENLLDHVLVMSPEDWLDEWRTSPRAFRSLQGCFTSGQWYIDNELKLRVPMGDTTYMDLNIRDVSDDESVYGWTQFDLRFPVAGTGLWGLRFRPTFDKSRQDVAVMYDRGNERSRFQLSAVMGFEDLFNKLWALRQTRVGDDAEPYEKHPFEPALRLAWRGAGPHAEIAGTWLTPARKRIDTRDPALRRHERLWGTKSNATVSQAVGPWTAAVRAQMAQVSKFAVWEQRLGDHHEFARRWRIELLLSRQLTPRVRFTARGFYQERTQLYRPPLGNGALSIIDRMPMVELSFPMRSDWNGRAGLMRSRITVVDDSRSSVFTWGTRVESRAFISIGKQFGRVRVQGTECIELDHEKYSVAFHHDKGFVHIQTSF